MFHDVFFFSHRTVGKLRLIRKGHLANPTALRFPFVFLEG